MGAVADVTDIVLPKIEEAERRGIEKVAKAMLVKGVALSDISEFTGLSEAEISKLKSEMGKD